MLLAGGLALATYGASRGPGRGWLSAAAAPAWTGGLALIAGYLLWARLRADSRARPPAVNLSLLASPLRSVTLALACVASVVLFAVLFLAPVFLQDVQHRRRPSPGCAAAAGDRHGAGQLAGQLGGRARQGPAAVIAIACRRAWRCSPPAPPDWSC